MKIKHNKYNMHAFQLIVTYTIAFIIVTFTTTRGGSFAGSGGYFLLVSLLLIGPVIVTATMERYSKEYQGVRRVFILDEEQEIVKTNVSPSGKKSAVKFKVDQLDISLVKKSTDMHGTMLSIYEQKQKQLRKK